MKKNKKAKQKNPENPITSKPAGKAATRTPLYIGAAVILAGILLFLLFKPGSRDLKGQLRDLNVILITLDTLRADHLSCYDPDKVATPHLDRLAAEGVLFERCIAQTPLTLPSHTTILSGTYPLHHQVRDNGGFIVPAELELLSEILQRQGFATSAFIAAYVLHSKWGLARGFDHYSDTFDLSKHKAISLGDVQKRADQVLAEARDWLRANRERRFFSWIHLFDPHTPYEPPSPFLERYPGQPYRGEVAYLDDELGKFLVFLEEQGLLDNSLVIVTGDHGESLGQHQEMTHGFFIYEASQWVPLIVRAPFPFPVKKVPALVQHVDLAPTVLEALALPVPPAMQGRSLLGLLAGDSGSAREFNFAYAETFYPRLHFGWSELKAFYQDDLKYILAPEDELYDLGRSRHEEENIVLRRQPDQRRLSTRLDEFIREQSSRALSPVEQGPQDQASLQKLAALGYITSFVDTGGRTDLADPKEKIGVFNNLARAKNLYDEGRFDEAKDLILGIIQDDPEITDAHMAIGNLYFREKNFKSALDSFRAVLERRPDYNFAMINILNSLKIMGRFREALEEVDAFLKIFPGDATLHFERGSILFIQKDYETAMLSLKQALEHDPGHAQSWNKIGEIHLLKGENEKASAAIRQAQEISPELRKSFFNLALIDEARGDLRRAEEHYRNEVRTNPENHRASYNLAELLRRTGRAAEAVTHYRQVIERNPHFNIPYFMIAKHLFDSGGDLAEAADLCRRGITLEPTDKYTAFGHFILADIFTRRGEPSRAAEHLARGREIMARFE